MSTARNMAGVLTFPGSNGDHDALDSLTDDLGVRARLVDYRETDLSEFGLIVLPGGFSYGDYLRCGAIARFAPVMEPLREYVERGGPALGICNGFQVLTEAHLLPGALLRNVTLSFHCFWTHIRTESSLSPWMANLQEGDVLKLPVAHGDGAYFVDPETLERLEGNGQVAFRYCEPRGTVTLDANRNGSVANIAGVTNERGNVLGLMPHPERATNELIGGADGRRVLDTVIAMLNVAV